MSNLARGAKVVSLKNPKHSEPERESDSNIRRARRDEAQLGQNTEAFETRLYGSQREHLVNLRHVLAKPVEYGSALCLNEEVEGRGEYLFQQENMQVGC